MRTAIAAAVACLSLAGLSVAADVQTSIRKNINIPAGGLGPALKTLSEEQRVHFVFISEDVHKLSTEGASGTLSVDEALDQLLKGTGLTYQYIDAETVGILPAAATSEVAGEGKRAGKSFVSRLWLAQASLSQEGGNRQNVGAGQAAQGSSTNYEGQGTIQEIVVTAQKREERLQDVPISISVLSAEQLDSSTARGVSEMLNRVPGVLATEASPGGATQLQVRGVGASYALASGSSPVGYYLDSVPFALTYSAILPDTNAYDMDRVEVLRGPQGTLYGANSMAGVVRVLTRDADLNAFEFKGRAVTSSTEGGSDNYRGDMAVNVPLVADKLAARLVAGYQSLSGWLDKPIQRNANEAQISNLRLKINGELNDRLSIGASMWRSRAGFGAPSTGRDDGTRNSFIDEPMSTDFDAQGLKVGYDFSGFSVISMTSHLDYVNDSIADRRAVTGQPPGTPIFLHYHFPARLFAQECNLVSTHEGPWRWSLGGLYRDEKDETRFFLSPPYVQTTRDVYESESTAVFSELTRTFLGGRFELTGGLRYFKDHVTQTQRATSSGAPPFGLWARKTFDSTTPRIVLTWYPNEQATVYASYGEGFRGGRAQHLTVLQVNPAFEPIEPDTLGTYELGAKGSLWGGRLTFDTALYYLEWQDIQQQIRVFDPSISNYIYTLINSQSASGMGLDLGFSAELVEGLTLGATFSTNDLTMDTDVYSGGGVLFSKGDRPNRSPERTMGASLDYLISLGRTGLTGRVSASANYVSSQANRQLSGTTVTINESDDLMIGRLSFSLNMPSGWTATIFADNINNENGFASGNDAVTDERLRIRPRTIGAQIEYRFWR